MHAQNLINAPLEEQKPPAVMLPEPEKRVYLDIVERADTILEYGSGGSTLELLKRGKTVVSVESDKDWLAMLQNYVSEEQRRQFHPTLVNVGPVSSFGYPASRKSAFLWWKYPVWPWIRMMLSSQPRPDVVVIDGRFRVACFVTSLFFAKKDTILLFDDYMDREAYHTVERHIKPVQIVGRMAIFRKSKSFQMVPLLSHLRFFFKRL